ncbi:MAG: hypothetical protein ACLFVO_11805 [Chloroflexaceae bacterium]
MAYDHYEIAIIVSIVTFLTLHLLTPVEKRIKARHTDQEPTRAAEES